MSTFMCDLHVRCATNSHDSMYLPLKQSLNVICKPHSNVIDYVLSYFHILSLAPPVRASVTHWNAHHPTTYLSKP